MRIDSQPGSGTKVIFTARFKSISSSQVNEGEPRILSPALPTPNDTSHHDDTNDKISNVRILVVDDSEVNS